MGLKVSSRIKRKLAEKHGINIAEVEQCFANRIGNFLKDTREKNETNPPTLWFIAEADNGKKLKVCFVHKDNDIYIKTAYQANGAEIEIYQRNA